MSDLMLSAYVVSRGVMAATAQRLRTDQRGEGVISAAIAVVP